VKLEQLTIQGFRVFNEPRTILFNDRLTLISAPNSYGKNTGSDVMECCCCRRHGCHNPLLCYRVQVA
jgi:predicted ATP-dependent endonuclease of OLD family